MGLVDASVNVFSGIKGLIYLLTAVIALIPMYKIYTEIDNLGGSTMLAITLAVVFWLISFFVVYIGTEQIFKGKELTSDDHERII